MNISLMHNILLEFIKWVYRIIKNYKIFLINLLRGINNDKKIVSIVFSVAVLIFISLSFSVKGIKDVADINYNNITKIVFVDGSGRNKPLKVENKKIINEFMGYIDNYSVIKAGDPDKIGWIRSASFYENDMPVMKITFVSPIIINDEYYKVMWGGLSQGKIDKFLKSINIFWISS